ncbi:unnamed protein product [Oreochromis niloticus]|nr:unnamed protein product [Mustela putorius furo]
MDPKFKWTKLFLLLMPMLQLTAAAEHFEFVVRDGDEVILPCNHVKDLCNSGNITWIFNSSRQREVELVNFGLTAHNYSKSDRLGFTQECFLAIKNVTIEDAGQYICKQFDKLGEQKGADHRVDLSVVTMTERKNIDIVTVKCSVLTYGRCRHTVMWMKNGQIWAVNNTSAKITQSTCSATATFLTYNEVYKSKYEFLSCSVTEMSGKEHLFSFYPLSPSKSKKTDWWMFIIVPVGLVLLIAVVVIIIYKRGKPAKMDTNTVCNNENDGAMNCENVCSSDGV